MFRPVWLVYKVKVLETLTEMLKEQRVEIVNKERIKMGVTAQKQTGVFC